QRCLRQTKRQPAGGVRPGNTGTHFNWKRMSTDETSPNAIKFVLLVGLSGSGKSVALNMLEDLGYHTMDNLPISSVGKVVASTLGSGAERYAHIAIGIDPRSPP